MTDIVERLNNVANLKPDGLWPEKGLDGFGANEWGTTICAICRDAIAEIMRLRTTVEQLRAVAGAVSVDGQSFADIKRDIGK